MTEPLALYYAEETLEAVHLGRHTAYPAYKPSGVEWLGDVPEHWTLKPLRYLGKAIIGLTYSPEDVASESEGILVLRASNIQNGQVKDADNVYVDVNVPDHLILRSKDILICSRSGSRNLIGKNALISQDKANSTFGAFMTVFRSPYNDFVYWVLNSQLFTFYSGAFMTTTINQLTLGTLKTFRTPVPPPEEQQAIARFLDDQTEKIDDLISAKRELLALLKEKRQAVITHAVTRGLDPAAKLQPSGVEWLGDVPEHWDVKPLRYLGKAIIGLTYSPEDVVSEGEGALVLRAGNIQNGQISDVNNVYVDVDFPDHLILRSKDILICSRSGSRNLIGKNALISEGEAGSTFGAFMTVFRSPYNDFLYWVLNSRLFAFYSGAFMTTTINQLTVGTLKTFLTPVPPPEEQRAIARFLDEETEKMDDLESVIREAIATLEVLRTSIISAAVTGKIDVRGATVQTKP